MGIQYETKVTVTFSGTVEEVLPQLEKAIEELRAKLGTEYVMLTPKSTVDVIRWAKDGKPFEEVRRILQTFCGTWKTSSAQLSALYSAVQSNSKIAAIRAVREITRYGLKEAKELVEAGW